MTSINDRLFLRGEVGNQLSSDNDLVKEAKRGDVNAYSKLISKYSNSVYAYAFHIVGNFHTAEDIAQDVFVKVFFNLSTLQENERFGPWLFKITKRKSLDWIKKTKKQQWILLRDDLKPLEKSPLVDEIIIRRESIDELRNALARLDEPHRLVLILNYLSGFTSVEISKLLKATKSTIDSRIRRAKQKLKKELIPLVEQTMLINQLGVALNKR